MRMKALLATALLCFMTVVAVEAQSLPSVRPEQVGLSSERLQRITDTLKADVDKRIIPGAIVLVARHGKIAYFETGSASENLPSSKRSIAATEVIGLLIE